MVETKTKTKNNFISFYINILKNYVYIIFKRANAYFSRLDFLFETFFFNYKKRRDYSFIYIYKIKPKLYNILIYYIITVGANF